MVAPTPEATADGEATASEATAVPARRRVTGKSPGFEVPSSTEGARRVERAPDRRHGGQVERPVGTDVQASAVVGPSLTEAKALGMRELASSSTGLPTYLPRGQDAGVTVPPTGAETVPTDVPLYQNVAVTPEERHKLTHLPYSAQCG
eukprot:13612858-Heterocapsa_arctica.AAC.1